MFIIPAAKGSWAGPPLRSLSALVTNQPKGLHGVAGSKYLSPLHTTQPSLLSAPAAWGATPRQGHQAWLLHHTPGPPSATGSPEIFIVIHDCLTLHRW